MTEPSKSDLKALLQKHEDRETPEQEKAESEEEQKEERAAGLHEKSAFWDGFEKRALNLATARAAMGRFKDKLIRRAPKLNTESVNAHIEGRTPKEKFISLSKDKLSAGGDPLRRAGHMMNVQGTVSSHPQANLKTFAKGDMLEVLAPGMKLPAAWNPKNREMTNRIMHLHEQAERKSFGKAKTLWAGSHTDPRVILEESNALASLPKKGYSPTKRLFHGLREADNTKHLLEHAVPKFRYGKMRLSRHGVKHMRRILEEKNMQAIPFPGTEIKKVAFWDGFFSGGEKKKEKGHTEALSTFDRTVEEYNAFAPMPKARVRQWRSEMNKDSHQGPSAGHNHFADKFNPWLHTPEGSAWNSRQADAYNKKRLT
jgi:hypothetical protein